MILAIILAIVVGLSASASLGGDGWFVGVLIGLLLGALIRAWRRINQLSARVARLERPSGTRPSGSVELATTTEPHTAPPVETDPPERATQTAPPLLTDALYRDQALLKAAREAEPERSRPVVAHDPVVQEAADHQPSGTVNSDSDAAGFDQDTPTTDLMSQTIDRLRSLNPFVIIGVIITFIGLTLLAKYAADNALFPIELRLMLISAAGIAMILAGYRLRDRAMYYGLILQGGGYAVIYLTVYAAAKYYDVVPQMAALIMMLAVVALATWQAVRQNAQPLALFATIGGFLTPILTSDGSGRIAVLFAYFLILNIGILCIAWFKSWRLLNWTGFVLTFGISMAWGMAEYTPAHYLLCQSYLIAFFSLYLAVSILFALKQPPRLKGLMDGSLTFGLPALTLTSQLTIVAHLEYGRALSALILGMLYLLIQWLIRRRADARLGTLCEALLMIGLVTASLSVPLALSQQWTGSVWVLEGLGLLWLGLRQQRLMLRLFGLLLMLIAQVISLPVLESWAMMSRPVDALPSPGLISAILLGLAAWWAAFWTHRSNEPSELERLIQWPLLASVVFWWLCVLTLELRLTMSEPYWVSVLIAVQATGTIAWTWLATRLNWQAMRVLTLVTLPVLAVSAVAHQWVSYPLSLLQRGGWLAWALASASMVFMLAMYRHHARLGMLGRALRATHLFWWILIWTILLLGSLLWIDQRLSHPELLQIITLITLPLASMLLVLLPPLSTRWPVRAHPLLYQVCAQLPALCGMLIVSLLLTAHDGQFWQMDYLPLIHPLDLAQLGGAVALIVWAQRVGPHASHVWVRILQGLTRTAGALAAFLWMNAAIARWVHHSTGVLYNEHALRQSTLFLTTTSIVWTSVALLLMVVGHRRRLRAVWMCGALLLGLAILKLFALDMANTGTLARIISFVAVGVLVLIIGYLAPLPPAAQTNTASRN